MAEQSINRPSLTKEFHQFHHNHEPLIIANIWNVKSARIAEGCGFKAIATSSGAIADSLGYKDGEEIPFDELLYIIKRIALSTSVPLSVDLERGYTNDPDILNNHVQRLIDLGVAGINLEDAQGEEIYLKKLTGVSEYLKKTNQQLFINARTDVFLQKLPDPLETTLRRAKLYQEAGANGLFVTAISDPELIRTIAESTTLPVNVVGVPKLASLSELASCGVKRISMAVFLYRASYSKMEMLAREVLEKKSLAPLYPTTG